VFSKIDLAFKRVHPCPLVAPQMPPAGRSGASGLVGRGAAPVGTVAGGCDGNRCARWGVQVPQIQLGETPVRHYGSRMTGPCFVADVMAAGLAVTIRADPVFVRADSSSTVDMIPGSPDLLERHSSFVRASRFQRHRFDILCLPQNPVSPALGAM
jgi:hypothetical protein